jgi:hypothetical protein
LLNSAQGLKSAAHKLDVLHLTENAKAHAEGHKEAQLKIAREMKQAGIPDSQIATLTQLSLEEIELL